MTDYGLVSVIMPSYNSGMFITETINSIRNQTYQNWEIIIVDDCSTDNTRMIINELMKTDSRIRYYRLEKNCGAAVARNTALRMAQGRWIAFLDSDDLWLPKKLEHQLAFMEEHDYSFSYHNYTECDKNGKPGTILISGPNKISRMGMMAFCWPGCLTVIYNRDAVGLIQIEDIRRNNDYAIWLKVSLKADCYILNENLAIYRRRQNLSIYSLPELICWQYRLFRIAEQYDTVSSCLLTMLNIICGLYKKIRYVKRK